MFFYFLRCSLLFFYNRCFLAPLPIRRDVVVIEKAEKKEIVRTMPARNRSNFLYLLCVVAFLQHNYECRRTFVSFDRKQEEKKKKKERRVERRRYFFFALSFFSSLHSIISFTFFSLVAKKEEEEERKSHVLSLTISPGFFFKYSYVTTIDVTLQVFYFTFKERNAHKQEKKE